MNLVFAKYDFCPLIVLRISLSYQSIFERKKPKKKEEIDFYGSAIVNWSITILLRLTLISNMLHSAAIYLIVAI